MSNIKSCAWSALIGAVMLVAITLFMVGAFIGSLWAGLAVSSVFGLQTGAGFAFAALIMMAFIGAVSGILEYLAGTP